MARHDNNSHEATPPSPDAHIYISTERLTSLQVSFSSDGLGINVGVELLILSGTDNSWK
jgi:hypothetical protein